MNYFDWESLFLQTDPKTQRERFEKMGLSEEEVVSRMTKILEAETLIPPLAMPGVGVGGAGTGIYILPSPGGNPQECIIITQPATPTGTFFDNGLVTTSATIDWNNGSDQEIFLGGNINLSFINGNPGQRRRLLVAYNHTGTRTISWPLSVVWSRGIQFTSFLGPGILDLNFSSNAGTINNTVYRILSDTDGNFFLLGSFTGTNRNRILLVSPSGSPDLSFSTGTGFDNTTWDGVLQTDGKLIVVGEFTLYNGTTANRIVRLNSNGSIDGTFNTGTGFFGTSYAVYVQTDGKILVGGDFTSYNGTARNRIIRLNSDGSIDGTFNIGTGFNGLVWSIKEQSDGKILIGGNFTTFDGNSRSRIIRLNSDGSIDGTFNIGTGLNGMVRSMFVHQDGKITLGGQFTSYNGTTRNGIIRLNSDGSIDGTFNIGTGFVGSTVYGIAPQLDGKLIVVGTFTIYNGTTANRIIRLNSDGSIDGTFNTGTGFDSSVWAVQIGEGKIILGGQFTTFEGRSAPNVSALYTINPPPIFSVITFDCNGTYYIGS